MKLLKLLKVIDLLKCNLRLLRLVCLLFQQSQHQHVLLESSQRHFHHHLLTIFFFVWISRGGVRCQESWQINLIEFYLPIANVWRPEFFISLTISAFWMGVILQHITLSASVTTFYYPKVSNMSIKHINQICRNWWILH